jgi:hypothetical protein
VTASERVASTSEPPAGETSGGASVAVRPRRTPSQIGRANNRKGKERENRLVKYLRINGFPGAERTVRTGYRTAGREFTDRGDIDGTPGLVWQSRAVSEPQWHKVPKFLIETEKQAKAAGADFGILVIPRPGHASPGEWWAHMFLSDLLRLVVGQPQAAAALHFGVRLELGELAPLLRVAGYGTPLDTEEVTA